VIDIFVETLPVISETDMKILFAKWDIAPPLASMSLGIHYHNLLYPLMKMENKEPSVHSVIKFSLEHHLFLIEITTKKGIAHWESAPLLALPSTLSKTHLRTRLPYLLRRRAIEQLSASFAVKPFLG